MKDNSASKSAMISQQPKELPRPTLYFAYRSNIWVAQMAKRCPDSRFIGKASLRGFRWQINSRGVANVVNSEADSTEGLVYAISKKDERRLDVNEGVAGGYYERHLLPVLLTRTAASPKVVELAETLQLCPVDLPKDKQKQDELDGGNETETQSSHEALHALLYGETSKDGKGNAPKLVEQEELTLVYLSTTYADDGKIRSEYISRMQEAKFDGLALGMSKLYYERTLDPHLKIAEKASYEECG